MTQLNAVWATLLILGSVASIQAQQQSWEADLVLQSLQNATYSLIDHFEEWEKDFDANDSGDLEEGHLVNSMLELQFLVVLNALREHPNPELLYRCLTFLSKSVPEEYDDIWRLIFLEMSDIDPEITRRADDCARERNLATLKERSMRKDPKVR